jgi:hypothetical protein
MAARGDVDASRMAVIGIGHAGYGVARSLAFESRFAAAVLAPGVVDVSRPWLDALPSGAVLAFSEEDRGSFERELHLAGLFSPEIQVRLKRLGRGYDLSGMPVYDLSRRICQFRLGDETQRIATPTLVRSTGPEPLWAAQAAEVRGLVPGAEQPACDLLGEDSALEWLDRFL